MDNHNTLVHDYSRAFDRKALETLDDDALYSLNEFKYPEIAPHSCAFCQNLCIGPDKGGRELLKWEGDNETVFTLADCAQGALNGCAFCSYIVWKDADLRGRSLEEAHDFVARAEDWSIFWEVHLWNKAVGPRLFIERDTPTRRTNDDQTDGSLSNDSLSDSSQTDDSQTDERIYICDFQLYTALNTKHTPPSLEFMNAHRKPLLNEFPPPNLVPDSFLSEQRACRWLKDCEQSHQKCRAYQGAFRPERLLEISQDGRMVRLQHDHAASTRYVTLSYCWGGDQPGKATKANLHALTKFFDVARLPASIRDGVKIAAKLRFRYIWVDALCIVQDDEEDKGEQIAKMHQIYTSSTLTIAGSSASTSLDGFLHPRVAWRPTSLKIKPVDGDMSEILAIPADTRRDDVPNANPLFTRAWAYQENQVSTRVLSFGTRIMAFFCLEAEQLDGGNPEMDLDDSLGRGMGDPGFINAGMTSLASASHPRAWTDLVKTYAGLGLSVPSDKLLALAALAQEYGTRLSLTKYLAGIWWEDIHWQLTWSRHPDKPTSRPPVYCGPSWSWCSVIGPIRFLHEAEKPSDLELLCSIVAASTTLVSVDQTFAQVSNGILTLEGRTRKLIWHNRSISDDISLHEDDLHARAVEGQSEAYCVDSNGGDRRLEVVEDVPEEWTSGADIELTAIEIFRFRTIWPEDFDWTFTRALLLQKIEDRGHESLYRRVGLLLVNVETGKDKDWFDEGSTLMELTIV